MPYAALPDRRMPYDIDGTRIYYGDLTSGAVTDYTGNAALLELQDDDLTPAGPSASKASQITWFFFFPESREITAFYFHRQSDSSQAWSFTGSNDTTNGLDGTWETASLPDGQPANSGDNFRWRTNIKSISFTGPKKNLRGTMSGQGSGSVQMWAMHLYGEPAAGAMAHDLIFIDHDDTPGVEFEAPEDFGDQPLGTTVVRQFRIKNTSATKTATGINIQMNDADFTIGTSGAGPWVVTINLASLGPGAESPTYYLRLTTPAVGSQLKPRFGRMTVVCDAGFFG